MYCEPLYGFPSPFKKFLPFSKAIFNHKQYKIILLSRGQILRIPFTRYSLDSVALHSKRGLQKYLLHGFWKSSRSEAQSYTPDLNPKPCLEIHFIWASSWNHCCPFLFLAYKPRQAQNPMTLTARPSRKAMVSPASRASTTGSTSSNATRTRKSFEVFSVKGMLTTSWPQGEVKRGKRWKAGTSAVPTRKQKERDRISLPSSLQSSRQKPTDVIDALQTPARDSGNLGFIFAITKVNDLVSRDSHGGFAILLRNSEETNLLESHPEVESEQALPPAATSARSLHEVSGPGSSCAPLTRPC